MALQFDHLQTDTIAAIATAMSEAGIGIIRISGPDAAAIGSKLYRTPKKNKTDIALWNPGTIRFGYIVETDEDGQTTVIAAVNTDDGFEYYTVELPDLYESLTRYGRVVWNVTNVEADDEDIDDEEDEDDEDLEDEEDRDEDEDEADETQETESEDDEEEEED
jgi:hypothetical protein